MSKTNVTVTISAATKLLQAMGYHAEKWDRNRIEKKINQIDDAPGASSVEDGAEESNTLDVCLKALADGKTIELLDDGGVEEEPDKKIGRPTRAQARAKKKAESKPAKPVKEETAAEPAKPARVSGKGKTKAAEPAEAAAPAPEKPRRAAKRVSKTKEAKPGESAKPSDTTPSSGAGESKEEKIASEPAEGRKLRQSKTRTYWAGVVLGQHSKDGFPDTITPAMVKEVDELYGKENAEMSLWSLTHSYHTAKGYLDGLKD